MENQNPKRIIEAALFISARELSVNELKKLTNVQKKSELVKIANELRNDYEKNGNAVEIVEQNGKFLMRIKKEYADSVREFAQDAEISKNAVRILSYIYKNEGSMLKSQVAKKLGAWVYPYIQELTEKEFVSSKKAGRTKRLILTDKFRKYFGAK